jgi:hypothetical protein
MERMCKEEVVYYFKIPPQLYPGGTAEAIKSCQESWFPRKNSTWDFLHT